MAIYDRFVLRIIHSIIYAYTVLCTWLTLLWRKPMLDFQHRKQSIDNCRKDSRKLAKLPNHLSLIVVENKISYSDIASVIVWCIAAGIPYISVYDTQGIFKDNTIKLTNHIAEKQRELSHADETKLTFEVFTKSSTIDGSQDSTSKTTTTDSIYHQLTNKRPKVIVIGPDDGKAAIVQHAKTLCEESIQRRHLSQELDVNDVDKILKASFSFPDPDLILKFGVVDSVLGFLPWQIRLTEILSYPSHFGISYSTFFNLLDAYSCTKQRFGK